MRYTIDYDCGGTFRVRCQRDDLSAPFRFVAESRAGALLPRKQVASIDCATDRDAIVAAKVLAESYARVEG